MSALERIDVDALVPDGFEPVEALRAWHFVGGKLFSLTNGTVWTPGQPLEATCRLGLNHPSPGERCACGIYAATTDAQLPHVSSHMGGVYGKVKLWGKIIPGERGVRAQYAYPSAFEVPARLVDHPALKAFGVPITVVTDRRTRVFYGGGGSGGSGTATAIQVLGLGGSAAAAQYAAATGQSCAQLQMAMNSLPGGGAAASTASGGGISVPYPLFPARNKPPTHDWLVPGVLALNIVGAAVNLSLLFHLWAP